MTDMGDTGSITLNDRKQNRKNVLCILEFYMAIKSEYNKIQVYLTNDGSHIKELMHPEVYDNETPTPK